MPTTRKKTSGPAKTPRAGSKAAGTTRVRIPLTQPWFEIRRSAIQGRGAFAVRTIPKGTRIIEYTGERISHAEADKRYDDEAQGRHHTFLFIATQRTVVDARQHGNEAKYINHACAPNCEAVIDEGRIFIEAVKRIRPGDELVYDYQYGRDGTETAEDEARYACRCGAKTCRGTILESVKEFEKRERAAKRKRRESHARRTRGRD